MREGHNKKSEQNVGKMVFKVSVQVFLNSACSLVILNVNSIGLLKCYTENVIFTVTQNYSDGDLPYY